MLAQALRLHWLFAYLFMLNGALYVVGLLAGGGFRSLLPRRTDGNEAAAMALYYALMIFDVLKRRTSKHPATHGKYNALQRGAYASIGIAGALSVLTGWAIHKPVQLWWVTAWFGGYDAARIWHFWLMWYFLLFTGPHLFMVLVDGWDTVRSMITGWSERVAEHGER
jgi:thiosulfate reductase cytochrome b subunit